MLQTSPGSRSGELFIYMLINGYNLYFYCLYFKIMAARLPNILLLLCVTLQYQLLLDYVNVLIVKKKTMLITTVQ